LKYYIISGEASGDLHGSLLIKALKKKDNNSLFPCWGGDRMQEAGGILKKHIRDLAFMGFTEVVKHLPTILSNIKFCKKDILEEKPDALILIDYPGFNLRIAEWAHDYNIPVIYYISPQIWAWKESRVHKIKKYVDLMMVILPFEKDFYAKYDMDVTFVGHPLVEALDKIELNSSNSHQQDTRIIALLPGSRAQEVSTMLPIMLKTLRERNHVKGVIAQAPNLQSSFYHQFISKDDDIEIIQNKTYDILANAHAALVTSGTATLETALLNTPQLVLYKGSWISYQLAKRLIKVKYISLVNLIMDQTIVPELIQGDANSKTINSHLDKILDGKERQAMLKGYQELRQVLKGKHTSDNAAEEVISFLNKKK